VAADRINVFVYSDDPVLQAGVAIQLRPRPEVWVIDDAEPDAAEVAVVVSDAVDDPTTTVIRALQRNGCPRVVLVVTRLDDAGVLAGVEAGACGFVRRGEATPEHLTSVITAAANGDGTLPPDLLGRFLHQVGALHNDVLAPRGLSLAGLTDREVEVLRMVSEGLDTVEIASRLCYSERTVKNVIHDVTTRLHLKNRSHAVAYAMRNGLI
jgi:DNA-binding NarL/FixJ family response regulator